MMTFTEKQKKAIENRGNILVSAAAGSGKTRVLTERICRLIKSGEAQMDDLLVLTFTDAAAAEMKKRIYETLMEISDSERLGIMAEKVASASISTIHSFCQRVIRDKYYVLGLSPSFNIAAEKDNARLLKKTLATLLEEHTLAEDDDVARLYLKYGKRNGKTLHEMILSIYHALMVMPEPETYLKQVLAGYKTDAYKSTLVDVLYDEAQKKLKFAKEVLENLKQLAETAAFFAMHTTLKVYVENLNALIDLFKNRKFDEAKAKIVFKPNLSYKEIESDDITDVFKRGRDEAKKQIDSVFSSYDFAVLEEAFSKEIPEVSKDARVLLELALTLHQRFSEAKQQKNMLDFSDLEHYAYEILRDETQAKDFNYKYIFIDEYQDTNPLQEAIIQTIKDKHNLFMVGDVKQSVYGFRHADPDIFLSKQNQYQEFDKKPFDDDELIRMNENFRSSDGVVGAVNHVMGGILTPEFGGIDYKNSEALVHGSSLSGGKAELLLIDASADFYAPEHNGDTLLATETEAFAIANKMMALKGTPFFSREANAEKPLDFCDMVVLLRELKNAGPVYKRVFESCGIPVDISFSSGGATLPETEQFANILKCILNPTDDIALISAMKTGFFEIDANDFVKIKLSAAEEDQTFYSRVTHYAKNHTDVLTEKIKFFFETLAHLKSRSLLLSGEAFLNEVYHTLRFEETLAASPRKSLKAEALKGYLRSLLSEVPKSAHLARMVLLLDEMKQNGEALDANSTHKNPNSVRIMTIHKSKGLEFPVVFVAGLDKLFKQDNKADFVLDKSLGLGFKLIEPKKSYKKEGLIYQSLIKKQRLLSLYEEVRVLYVAMTRAENQLFLVSGVKGLKNSFCDWLAYGKDTRAFAKNYLDLIAPMLLDKSAFAQGFTMDRFLPPTLSRSSLMPISVLPKRGYAYPKAESRMATLDGFLNKPAKPVEIGYTYAKAETLAIPSKRSVSSLKPKGENTMVRKQVAFTALDASSLNAAERGTAFHVYMQHADFNHTSISEIKNHIALLVREEIISADEAVTLSAEKIMTVLESDMMNRAKKARLLYREKNFSLKMDSGELGLPAGEMVLVQGTIDLCFIEDDAFVLVDYKTDQVTKDSVNARVENYRIQIETYARALTLLTGYPVKEKHLYFLNHKCIQV